jgi:hypothetical protein
MSAPAARRRPTAQTGSAAEPQAKALLDWMRNRVGDGGEIAVRDVLRLGPSATRRLDAAEAALETLARHGWTEEVSSRPRVIRVWASRESDRHEGCDVATDATVPGTKAEPVASAAPQASRPENSAVGAPSVATSREAPEILASGPAAWRAALVALSPDRDPCPGFFEPGAWARVRAAALSFVEEYGDRAEELGWGKAELFGVHCLDGVARPDCCGVLMLRGLRVVRVTSDEIRFANRLAFHRRKGQSRPIIPVWEFGVSTRR